MTCFTKGFGHSEWLHLVLAFNAASADNQTELCIGFFKTVAADQEHGGAEGSLLWIADKHPQSLSKAFDTWLADEDADALKRFAAKIQNGTIKKLFHAALLKSVVPGKAALLCQIDPGYAGLCNPGGGKETEEMENPFTAVPPLAPA